MTAVLVWSGVRSSVSFFAVFTLFYISVMAYDSPMVRRIVTALFAASLIALGIGFIVTTICWWCPLCIECWLQ